jgi:hypothetical protein
MTHLSLRSIVVLTSLATGTLLSLAFAGCANQGSGSGPGYRSHYSGAVHTSVMFEDDYDYYPGYEVYYSRNRNEYVYREGNFWVRRPEPSSVALSVLRATPSVRVDFRDSPEKHHASVTKSYPRNWRPPARAAEERPAVKDDRKDDRPDNKRNERDQADRKASDEHRSDDHKQD